MGKGYWLPAILLSLSSNLDNAGVGIAYGIRRMHVPFSSNLLIALITSAGTLAAMLAGKSISRFMGPGLANFVGGALLIGLGGWAVFQEYWQLQCGLPTTSPAASRPVSSENFLVRMRLILTNPFSVDEDFSRHIDKREALVLGVALSMNNLVNGVAAGIAGMEPALVTTLVFTLSILMLWGGISAGYRFGARVPSRYTGVVSGVLLISIGVYEFFI